MLTNTLLLYMTQEALTKARQRLKARKGEVTEVCPRDTLIGSGALPHWRTLRRMAGKRTTTLRH